MTATHLKRLFANQDVFNSLDRNVAGLSVSEADEKEIKSSEGGSEISTQTPTPTEEIPPCLEVTSNTSPETAVSPDDGNTPVAGVISEAQDPLRGPTTPREQDFDSDSTISAHPARQSPIKLLRPAMADTIESSGVESDAHHFVSRLPRRSRPTPR